MIDKVSTDNCCTCKACAEACALGAIHYSNCVNGFLYPVIDAKKCVRCNRCETVCPVLKAKNENPEKLTAYIGKNPDVSIRMNSTSGGIFYALAEKVINSGGLVCGAIMTEDFRIKHILTNKQDEVLMMLGSKYAQSDLSGCYRKTREQLEKDNKILFSGCPCQIAALKSYLGKDYDNLYCVEVVCHGIPSENLLQGYIKLLSARYGSNITNIKFRDKTLGWHSSSVSAEFENGKVYREPITVDAYMKGFLTGVTIRESCYHCKFRRMKSGADLMLGDFWGAEAEMPEKDDNTGLSGILVNSQKGMQLLGNANLELMPYDVEKIIHYNQNIVKDTQYNPLRKAFFEAVADKGEGKAILEYFWEKPTEKYKRKLMHKARQIKHAIKGDGPVLY